MKALIFSKKSARTSREYTSKSGEAMTVIPMLLLETGELVEQHFPVADWASMEVDQMYFGFDNKVVCELITEQKGLSQKITGVEILGLFDYKIK